MTTFEGARETDVWKHARCLYEKHPGIGVSLEEDLLNIARTGGYVYCGPECIIAAIYEDETWFVYLAAGVGAMSRFFEVAPHESKWVTFERPAKKRVYCRWEWRRIKALCIRRSMKTF